MYLTAHQARMLQDPQLDKQFHTTLDAIKLAAELGRDSLILEDPSTRLQQRLEGLGYRVGHQYKNKFRVSWAETPQVPELWQ